MQRKIKLPIGIEPRHIWMERRMRNLQSAIERYANAEINIPNVWIQEFIELGKELKILFEDNPELLQEVDNVPNR